MKNDRRTRSIATRLALGLLATTTAGMLVWAGSSSQAAPVAKGAVPTAPAWQVLPGSTLGFRSSWNGSALTGGFKTWTADIHFDPAALGRSSVKVTVDLATVSTDYYEAGEKLPNDSWFDVAKFPQAIFAANRFESLGGDNYRASGTLSIKGISQPVTFPFRLTMDGDQASMSAEIKLDRTQFGLGTDEYKGTDVIPAEVAVDVKLTAKRQA